MYECILTSNAFNKMPNISPNAWKIITLVEAINQGLAKTGQLSFIKIADFKAMTGIESANTIEKVIKELLYIGYLSRECHWVRYAYKSHINSDPLKEV